MRQLLDKNRSGELQCAAAEVDCSSKSAIGRLFQSAFSDPSTISMLHLCKGEFARIWIPSIVFKQNNHGCSQTFSAALTQLEGERAGYAKL